MQGTGSPSRQAREDDRKREGAREDDNGFCHSRCIEPATIQFCHSRCIEPAIIRYVILAALSVGESWRESPELRGMGLLYYAHNGNKHIIILLDKEKENHKAAAVAALCPGFASI
jgi:hypothetical protein